MLFLFPHATAHLEHTHACTHALRKHSEDKLRVASIQLPADMSQSQLACLIDHLSRAASDRVSPGDQGEASALGSECHHGKLTPHSPGPELRFNSVASSCQRQLQTPRCFRGGRCGLGMSLGGPPVASQATRDKLAFLCVFLISEMWIII